MFVPRVIRINLIILLIFVLITNVDCRTGGRGKAGRNRMSKLLKNKIQSSNTHYQASFIRKPNNHLLASGVAGGGAAFLIGTLALQAFVSNNNKASILPRQVLINGTGSLCLNREAYSNFIFNSFHCPLLPIYSSNKRYCCGAFQRQYCCSFWESGSRAIGAIIGIISGCSLVFLFIICCIVYYRRYLKRKGTNDPNNIEQPQIVKRSIDSIHLDPPPPYSEVVRCLTDS